VLLALAIAGPGIAQAATATAPTAAPAPLVANPGDAAFARQSADWNRALDRAAQELHAYRLADADIQRLRDQVLGVRDEAVAARATAQGETAQVKRLTDALGPPPAADAAPEAAEVAKQRRDLIAARAEQLLGDITNQRFRRFADQLTERGPSPANPATWRAAFDELGGLARAYSIAGEATWRQLIASSVADQAVIAGALLLAVALGWPLRWFLLRRFGRAPVSTQPSYPRRVGAAIAVGAARGVLPALAILALVTSLFSKEADLVTGGLAALVLGLAGGGVLYLVLSGISRAALAPEAPGWRILDFSDAGAASLARRFDRLIALVAIQLGLDIATQRLSQIDDLASLVVFVLALLIAAAILRAVDPRQWTTGAVPVPADESAAEAALDTSSPWSTVRLGAVAVALAAPIVALAGYATLARFLYMNLCETALVLGLALLFRVFVREALPAIFERETGFSASLRQTLVLGPQAVRLWQFWLIVLFDVALWLVATLVVLSFWGMSWGEMGRVGVTLLQGVRIGGYTFSLADFLAAGAIFAVVLAGTRFVQRLLEHRVFPRTRLDLGVRNSLKAGIGYFGLVLGATMAISTLGLNLSNLALIAGALSVGIGFGLQNIVNNFVSGLLLLIERPIKVGDWVVVGDKEGFVKRISVRSTEIETFRRAAVIIPNSELLTNAVTNWTHKDRLARVDIAVGVDYAADPHLVGAILVECARAHPLVSKHPLPRALLEHFGTDALQFVLQCFIDDVMRIRDVESALRIAVLEAFRAQGINMPTREHAVTLKDLDGIAALLREAAQPAAELPAPRPALQPPGRAASGD
jgi:potassium efflux system protein